MKKILLCSAALVGVAFAAAPAMAQVDVTVGGHTKNYIGYLSQDTTATQEERNFDMLRESEIHFNAEGTADNGLTYGFHVEVEADGGDAFTVEESYLYLASSLGRVNLGSEDGAAYLLQVAAPSADSNVDGLRQYINPVNYTIATASGATAFGAANRAVGGGFEGFDYDNDETGTAEKITYLSPNWNGFQFGLSYTPDVLDNGSAPNALGGFNTENTGAFEDAYEAAVRYEGTFNNVGFAVGAGYTHVENESAAVNADDLQEWNVGADLDIGAFGLGAVYTTENRGLNNNGDSDTWVVGVDYTTGPFQFGASYFNNNTDINATTDVDTDRYTGGVIYTVTQGLSLRGSVSYIEHDATNQAETDATSVLGGIQFNF